MKIRLVSLAIILTAITSVAHAKRVDPYKGSRIFWDTSSQTTIFPTGNYARLIELQDGRLLAAAESGGIAISFSENKGPRITEVSLSKSKYQMTELFSFQGP